MPLQVPALRLSFALLSETELARVPAHIIRAARPDKRSGLGDGTGGTGNNNLNRIGNYGQTIY